MAIPCSVGGLVPGSKVVDSSVTSAEVDGDMVVGSMGVVVVSEGVVIVSGDVVNTIVDATVDVGSVVGRTESEKVCLLS